MPRPAPSPYTHHSPSQSSDSLSEAENEDGGDLDPNKSTYFSDPVAVSPARWSQPRRPSLSQPAASPIGRLPAEIIIHVLRYLHSSRELFRALLVCRTWCACSVELLWHKPAFQSVGTLVKMMRVVGSENQAFTYSAFVRRLNFMFLGPELTDALFCRVAQCVRLERLTLVNCRSLSDDTLTRVLGWFPHLVALDLTSVSDVSDRALLALASSSKRLQGINLGGCKKVTDRGILALARNCPLLRRVKLSGLENINNDAVSALAKSCPLILEIDLNHCGQVTDRSVRDLWTHSFQMREMRLSHCEELTEYAFPASSRIELPLQPKGPNPFPSSQAQQPTTDLPPLRIPRRFEHLRMLDLTSCVRLTDDAIDGIISSAPKIRNLVLAKCSQLTDRSVETICRLGKHLHYLHLGHCLSITDSSVKSLARSCTRLRYIDLANCTNLTDMAVFELSSLPKLRRVGLVRVASLTDEAIYALGERHATLERIHLSYCNRISIMSIHFLLQKLPKLTHLSLTGIPAFRRPELQKFCRPPPPDFNPSQRNAFCVFSGSGVDDLRDYLTTLFKSISELQGTDDTTDYDEDTYDDQYPVTYMDDEIADGYDAEDGDVDGDDDHHHHHSSGSREFVQQNRIPQPEEPIPAPSAITATGLFGRASAAALGLRSEEPPGAASSSSATLSASEAADTPPTAVGTPAPEPDRPPAPVVRHGGFGSRPLVEEAPASPPPPSEAGSVRSAGTAHTAGSGAAFFRTYAQRAVSPSSRSQDGSGALTPDLIFAEIGHGRGTDSHGHLNYHHTHNHAPSAAATSAALGATSTAIPPGAVFNQNYNHLPHPHAGSPMQAAPTSHQLPMASGVIGGLSGSQISRHPHPQLSASGPSTLPGGVGYPMGSLAHHGGGSGPHTVLAGASNAPQLPSWDRPVPNAFSSLARMREELPPATSSPASVPGWTLVNRPGRSGSATSSVDDLVEQEGRPPKTMRRGLKSTLSAAEHFLFGRGEGSSRGPPPDGVGPRGH